MSLVKTSFKPEDVKVLLTDLTGIIEQVTVEELESRIHAGQHYSTMLPTEFKPTEEYFELYRQAMDRHAKTIAEYVVQVGDKMLRDVEDYPVIISLARAGTPVGVLIKRYFDFIGIKSAHYSVSIIRDRGLDDIAMWEIYTHERTTPKDYRFVDGWTGKGAISRELKTSVALLKATSLKWSALRPDLYVLADPAGITDCCATHDDFLLPNALLNAPVSGCISRTIRNELVGKNDFDGAVYLSEFEGIDVTYDFIDRIEAYFPEVARSRHESTKEIIERIKKDFDVKDSNMVKPGIGEATRVLLRRVPRVLLYDTDKDNPDVQHIFNLAKEKNVPCLKFELGHFKVCSIIKEGDG